MQFKPNWRWAFVGLLGLLGICSINHSIMLGKPEGDIFTGKHYFLIEPIGENKRRFTRCKKLTGLMVA